jgi:spore germination protein YaaH
MVAKNPARYVAPVAIIAVAIAVFMIVRARVDSHHVATAPPVHQLPVSRPRVASKHRFYVIKPGDSLSRISVKTGVSIATLEALNPSVDPNALQTGQRIRLRR